MRCTIYTLLEPFMCDVELQVCPDKCSGSRSRHIGPDGSEIGLFNYNNSLLFSHDLLDDYTLSYTTSETPFTSWVKVIQQRYERFTTGGSFVSIEIFRAVWFKYAALQSFGNDMRCPVCGPEPRIVIFDGITLAYGKKHLTSSLRPPTAPDPLSEVQECTYVKRQEGIPDKKLRGLIKFIITGRSLVVAEREISSVPSQPQIEDSDSGMEEVASTPSEKAKMLAGVLERVKAIPVVEEGLRNIDQSLSLLFTRYCGVSQVVAKKHSPSVILALFRQVWAFVINWQSISRRPLFLDCSRGVDPPNDPLSFPSSTAAI